MYQTVHSFLIKNTGSGFEISDAFNLFVVYYVQKSLNQTLTLLVIRKIERSFRSIVFDVRLALRHHR